MAISANFWNAENNSKELGINYLPNADDKAQEAQKQQRNERSKLNTQMSKFDTIIWLNYPNHYMHYSKPQPIKNA